MRPVGSKRPEVERTSLIICCHTWSSESLFLGCSLSLSRKIDVVVHIGTGYALDGFAHALLAFPNEQMEVIRHEAIGIVGTIGSAILLQRYEKIGKCLEDNEKVAIFAAKEMNEV